MTYLFFINKKNHYLLIIVCVLFTVRSHVFEARIVVENYGNIRMITVKSNSTGEKIEIHPNCNFNLRTQTSFIENSCDVGIAKVMRDNRTEFAATVRNCRNKN